MRGWLLLVPLVALTAWPPAGAATLDDGAPDRGPWTWRHTVDLGRPVWPPGAAGGALALPTRDAEGVEVVLGAFSTGGRVTLVDAAGLRAARAGQPLDAVALAAADVPGGDGRLRLSADCGGPCGPLHLAWSGARGAEGGPPAAFVRLSLTYRMENPALDAPASHGRVPALLRVPGFHAAAVVEDDAVRAVADGLARRMEGVAATPLQRATFLLDFLQVVDYRTDRADFGVAERTRLPDETLRDGRGDCEDVAILYAALARRLGLDAVLVELSLAGPDGRPMGRHLAVGVDVAGDPAAGPDAVRHGGRTYHYVEATGHRAVGVNPWDRPGAERDGVPVRVQDVAVQGLEGPRFLPDSAAPWARAANLVEVVAWVHPWLPALALALPLAVVVAVRCRLTLEAPCLRR